MKEGLNLCQDIQLQQKLKKEMWKTKQELGDFCKQFDASVSPNSGCHGSCQKYKKKPKKPLFQKPTHKPYRKPYKPHKRPTPQKTQTKQTYSGPKLDLSKVTCYKCKQKGHTARFCKFQKRLQELNLTEDVYNQIQNLSVFLSLILIFKVMSRLM